MTIGRTKCVLPFCRRTTHADWDEWICAEHWRGVRRRTRWLHFAIRRKVKRDPGLDPRFAEMRRQNWRRCKRQALEAAAGLR